MNCIYCKRKCVKYGAYSDDKQRYKCSKCERTFSSTTIENYNTRKDKRMVFHLLLAGCTQEAIAESLNIDVQIIEKWMNVHFRNRKTILPEKELLAINTLLRIYNAIEKSHISEIHNKKRRLWRRR